MTNEQFFMLLAKKLRASLRSTLGQLQDGNIERAHQASSKMIDQLSTLENFIELVNARNERIGSLPEDLHGASFSRLEEFYDHIHFDELDEAEEVMNDFLKDLANKLREANEQVG